VCFQACGCSVHEGGAFCASHMDYRGVDQVQAQERSLVEEMNPIVLIQPKGNPRMLATVWDSAAAKEKVGLTSNLPACQHFHDAQLRSRCESLNSISSQRSLASQRDLLGRVPVLQPERSMRCSTVSLLIQYLRTSSVLSVNCGSCCGKKFRRSR